MKNHVRPDNDPMAEELALLGHDLRSAVTDVMAGLAMIDQTQLSATDRLQLDRAKATAESLVRYLEEGMTTLLAQAPPLLEQAPTNLALLLQDLKRRWGYAVNNNANAVIITAANVPKVVPCNRTAVDRILSNLISNAIKYSQGQTIRLDVTHPSAELLCFTITDQGPGFPANIGERPGQDSALPAWESREGHGLGLSIAQTLARRMGATLDLRNSPDGGGVATLCLPISLVPEGDAPPPVDARCLLGKRVLIADDSMPQLLLLAQFLRDCGAQITMVRDGVAAEKAIETGSFDLALIDLEMPGRTGLEICKAFHDHPNRTTKPTRIVILTAHHLPDIHQRALSAGAAQVLVKPITSSQALAEALCQHPPEPPSTAPTDLSAETGEFTRLLEIAGPEMARELLARYHEDLTSVQNKLVAALPELDWQSLRAASHVLIALAGTAGMVALEHNARAFNLAANDNNRSEVLSQKDAMLDGLTDLLTYVQQIAQERQGH